MPQFYYDLLFCATFVLVAVALLIARKKVFSKDPDAYERIMIGMFLFCGFSLLQLLGNQGLLSGVAILEDTFNRKMVEAVTVVAGLIFLLTGVGAWLPSMQKKERGSNSGEKKYQALKMIAMELGRAHNMDDALGRVVNYLSAYLGMPRCMAYLHSRRERQLILRKHTGQAEIVSPLPTRMAITGSDLEGILQRRRVYITSGREKFWQSLNAPYCIVPLSDDIRMFGALFCWLTPEQREDKDLIDFLEVVSHALGRFASEKIGQVRQAYTTNRNTAYERLVETCNRASSIGQAMTPLFDVMQWTSGAEFMSLAVLDGFGENMTRYSIGSSGRLLLEKGVSRSTRGTGIQRIFKTGAALWEPNLEPEKSYEDDGLLISCGMRSKIMLPIKASGKVLAVVTLGSTRKGQFTRHHLRKTEGVIDVLAGVIQRERAARTTEVREDQMLRLQLLERDLMLDGSVENFFDSVCDVLTNRLSCTMARISIIDRDGKNMFSSTCRTIRDTGHNLRENETIPMSLLPWHRMSVTDGKLLLINQEDSDSQMPAQESNMALLPDIKSAILVPIMMKGKTRGIISIGEARNWNRRSFSASDLLFAKDVAAKCSVALLLKQKDIEADNLRHRLFETHRPEIGRMADLKTRISGPLTSIIGAAEILKVKGIDDGFGGRYHRMILDAACRIKDVAESESEHEPLQYLREAEQVLG